MKSFERVERKVIKDFIKSTVGVFSGIFKDRNIKVVDVGTRTGYAVKLLNEAGYKAIGVDVDCKYVDYAVHKGRNVIYDDFENSRLPDGEYDVVFSRHTLEHFKDTAKFLATCKRILKDGGAMFITFPLEKHVSFEREALKYGGVTKSGHRVSYESSAEFGRVVEAAGIKIEYLGPSANAGIKPMKREILFIGRKPCTNQSEKN